jgi:hypothetical protein
LLPKTRSALWVANDQLLALRVLPGKTGGPVAAQVRITNDK